MAKESRKNQEPVKEVLESVETAEPIKDTGEQEITDEHEVIPEVISDPISEQELPSETTEQSEIENTAPEVIVTNESEKEIKSNDVYHKPASGVIIGIPKKSALYKKLSK